MKYIEKRIKNRLRKAIENVTEHHIIDKNLSYWNGNRQHVEKYNFNSLVDSIMKEVADFLFVYLDANWRK